jgi:hypothetical protein
VLVFVFYLLDHRIEQPDGVAGARHHAVELGHVVEYRGDEQQRQRIDCRVTAAEGDSTPPCCG